MNKDIHNILKWRFLNSFSEILEDIIYISVILQEKPAQGKYGEHHKI